MKLGPSDQLGSWEADAHLAGIGTITPPTVVLKG
jgi:hypothetical protein